MEYIIASIIISGITQGISAALKKQGAKLTKQGQALVREMYNKIASNQNLIEDLQRAYNNRDGELLNALYSGIGFGRRVQSIKDARQRVSDEYKVQRDKVANDTKQLENNIDKVNQAISRGNDMTISGIKDAQKSINQMINGGSTPERTGR